MRPIESESADAVDAAEAAGDSMRQSPELGPEKPRLADQGPAHLPALVRAMRRPVEPKERHGGGEPANEVKEADEVWAPPGPAAWLQADHGRVGIV